MILWVKAHGRKCKWLNFFISKRILTKKTANDQSRFKILVIDSYGINSQHI